MKRVVIKPYLIKMMKDHYPEYELTKAKGLFYLFRRKDTDGLYDYIEFQREGAPYNQLAITESGVGYNEHWDGMPSNLAGYCSDISYIMKPEGFPKPDGWVKYGETEETIADCMEELRRQIEIYVHPHYEAQRKRIFENELMVATDAVLRTELPKETPEGIEEMKALLWEGSRKDAKRYIYDYKNYRRWHDLINSKVKRPVEFNNYIFIYIKDYCNFYF